MSRERIRTGEADDMEEKSDSLTSFVGRDESFKFGYYSGCSVAITPIVIVICTVQEG